MADHRQRSVRKGGNAEIRPDELMASWVYDEKFPTDMQFLFRTLPLTVGEDNDLEHPAQEQEKRRTTTIGFEFPRDLKNSVTIFQQPAMKRSDRWSSTTTDWDSIYDNTIFQVSPWCDPNREARRINIVGRRNQEAVNSSSK
jgi:hypothetical protein